LLEVIGALCSFGPAGPVLIVDDDPGAREFYREAVETGLPGCQTRLAADGTVALAMITEQVPCLVILDLAMPELDGFEVLDWMRSNPQTRQVPVLVLSGRVLSFDDIKRLERYAQVILQSKDIWSEHETTAVLHRMLFDDDGLPVCTSSLVKRAVAYFHEHYARPLSRQEMAKAIGVHQDYLSQIFHQELGLCPWDYLNRYRIARAKDLLGFHNASITAVAFDVGFSDPAYFSRVFRKVTGLSPSAYRQSLLKQGRSL
jgi:YesN/AraC family two-component response regulator